MHIAEVVTIAKSLPLLRLNTYKSLILSYSADYRRIFIGKNLLLFGKQLHTIQMPDIANEQEQAFMKAMRNDDFNAILELKMRGYQPSENVLKSLQPDISATNFIAAAKIFQMEGMLKSLQDIKPVQSPIIGGNKRSMELGD